MKSFKYITIVLLSFYYVNVIAQIKDGFLPRESSYSVILEKSDIKLANTIKLFIAPNRTILTLVNNIIVPLYTTTDKEENKSADFAIDLSKKYPDVQDIMWLNNIGIIIRYGKRIINITDKGITDIITMYNENFSLYPARENLIYIALYNKDNSTSLFLFDVLTKESIKLIDLPYKISGLEGQGDFCFVSSGNDIYYLSKKVVKKVYSVSEPVISMAISDHGLFYGTKKGVYYMDEPQKSIYFLSANVKQLLCNGNMLYIFTQNGSMSIIDNVNGYHNMYQRIQNSKYSFFNKSEQNMLHIEEVRTIEKNRKK